jgi:hypothetical protein
VARGYRSWYRGRRYPPKTVAQKEENRWFLSGAVGGIDREIEQIFLGLDETRMEALLEEYGQLHGSSAKSYAKRAIPEWRSRSVAMSGKVARRLVDLVPRFASHEERFRLVKALRTNLLPTFHRRLVVNHSNWRQILEPALEELAEDRIRFELPQHILARLHWLNRGDTGLSLSLLERAEAAERQLRISYLTAEIQRLATVVDAMPSYDFKHQHSFAMEKVSIELCFETTLWFRLKRFFQGKS